MDVVCISSHGDLPSVQLDHTRVHVHPTQVSECQSNKQSINQSVNLYRCCRTRIWPWKCQAIYSAYGSPKTSVKTNDTENIKTSGEFSDVHNMVNKPLYLALRMYLYCSLQYKYVIFISVSLQTVDR